MLVQALRSLEAEENRLKRRHPAYVNVEHPINFNPGVVVAGDWPSSVPEVCTVEVRLSCFPGEKLEEVETRVRAHLRQAIESDPWLRSTRPEIAFFGFRAEGAVYDSHAEIGSTLASCHEAITGRPLLPRPITATTDNRFFQLYYGIPSVCYGPTGGQLHAPDEWVDLESVRICTRVLASTLADWCGVA